MATWQLQDAKARLSEMIDTAKREGPQIITQRGVSSAVLVPFGQWEIEQHAKKPTLMEILQSSPRGELPVPARSKWKMRKPVKL